MENIKEVLEDLGLSEREAKIYLLLIKDGELSAFNIARTINIDRTTVYDVLEKLISQGLVSTYIKNKTKQFVALDPKELLAHYKEKFSSLERILPELNKIKSNKDEKASCEMFVGINGIKIVLKELFKRGLSYKVIGIRDEYQRILGFFNDTGTLKPEFDS